MIDFDFLSGEIHEEFLSERSLNNKKSGIWSNPVG